MIISFVTLISMTNVQPTVSIGHKIKLLMRRHHTALKLGIGIAAAPIIAVLTYHYYKKTNPLIPALAVKSHRQGLKTASNQPKIPDLPSPTAPATSSDQYTTSQAMPTHNIKQQPNLESTAQENTVAKLVAEYNSPTISADTRTAIVQKLIPIPDDGISFTQALTQIPLYNELVIAHTNNDRETEAAYHTLLQVLSDTENNGYISALCAYYTRTHLRITKVALVLFSKANQQPWDKDKLFIKKLFKKIEAQSPWWARYLKKIFKPKNKPLLMTELEGEPGFLRSAYFTISSYINQLA